MSSGVVRFGASGILVAHFLAPILVKFEAAYPTTCVELVEREDVELEGKVLSGELDCAVVTPWRSSRAAARYLSTEEIMAVLPIAHRLATKSAVTLNMLRNEPLLLPSPGMNLFRVITDAFHRAGIEPKIGHQSGYPELSLNLARMGLGVAPMPRMLVSSKVREDLVAVPFRESVARDLVIIYSWDRPLSAATRALVTHIQQELLPPAGRVAEFRERWDRSRRPRRAIAGPS
jgi:DNA-binding transcriptional LysR family regulator